MPLSAKSLVPARIAGCGVGRRTTVSSNYIVVRRYKLTQPDRVVADLKYQRIWLDV